MLWYNNTHLTMTVLVTKGPLDPVAISVPSSQTARHTGKAGSECRPSRERRQTRRARSHSRTSLSEEGGVQGAWTWRQACWRS